MKWQTRKQLLKDVSNNIVKAGNSYTLSPQFLLTLPNKKNLKKNVREAYEPIAIEIAEELHEYMKDVVPAGLMLATGKSYKAPKKILINKLQMFFEYFEDEYSKEEILLVHKQYTDAIVQQSNGYYPTSAHVIIKKGKDGELNSDLASYIEAYRAKEPQLDDYDV